MDTFNEQIVKKEFTVKDYLINAEIIVLALAAVFFACLLVPRFSLIIAVAVIWGACKLLSRRNLEYEYICTNGEIDIDKIMNKQSRRRIITVSAKTFDLFEPAKGYDKNKLGSMGVRNKIYAVSKKDSDSAYVAVLGHKGVKTALFFEPNEEIINEINKYRRIGI